MKQRSDAAKSRWKKRKEESGRNTETLSGRNAPTPTIEEKTPSPSACAKPFPPNWEPSAEVLERAKKTRPDIQPARLKLETQGFIARQKADNRHSHVWDESFIG